MLSIDIVSPTGQVVSGIKSDRVIVQSLDGQITILPGHRDMMCILGKGLLYADGISDKFVIYGGVLDISGGETLSIAADKIVKISDLDENSIKASIKEIEQKLNNDPIGEREYKVIMNEYLDHIAELGAVLS